MFRRPGIGRRLLQGGWVGLAAAGLALGLQAGGWLARPEAWSWDWRVRLLAGPGAATGQVCLVLLDQASLDWAREENGLSWPWPRELYAAVADFCRRQGARSLTFDVLFTEPSLYGVADDQAFGASLAAFGRAAGSVFLGQRAGSERRWPEGLPGPGPWLAGADEHPGLAAEYGDIVLPVPEVAEASAALGNVQLAPDPDGVYRRAALLGRFDGRAVPALGVAAYLAAHPGARGRLEAGRLTVGEAAAPLDDRGAAVLRFRGPAGTHRAYSAAAVLQSELRLRAGGEAVLSDPEAFRGKHVLFGLTAPGLFDLRPTPVGAVYPGVELQATLLDNLLSGDFLRDAAPGLGAALVVALALGAALLAAFFTSPGGTAAAGFALAPLPVGAALLAYGQGVWLPLAAPGVALAAAAALSLAANYAAEGRQKRFLKGAFRQYLSPDVVEELIAHPERLKLGGERRTLSIFFSDLQGFTSISEALEPEALTALLNDYLSAMTDIIHEEGGTVDKYEGDAIIAFWNAPLPRPDHAERAVTAALRCQARLAELGPGFRERAGRDLLMRIGLNTGPAVVGNLGSRTRFDYTMLGDAVNLAARLEGANKEFGTYTLISQTTRKALGPGFAARELARLVVVGKQVPVTVYEPLPPGDAAARGEALAAFGQGLALYYEGRLAEAARVFAALAPGDPAARAYAARLGGLGPAAPPGWRGEWVMTSKG
ncbi:MAG: CHASE2 domain-containing protein [Deferrisomatales bacterium]